jgi:hypothetical protein
MEYRQVNRESIKDHKKVFDDSNKDKVLQKVKDRYDLNKDIMKACQKAYRENHEQVAKQRKHAEYEKNQEQISQEQKERRVNNKDKSNS